MAENGLWVEPWGPTGAPTQTVVAYVILSTVAVSCAQQFEQGSGLSSHHSCELPKMIHKPPSVRDKVIKTRTVPTSPPPQAATAVAIAVGLVLSMHAAEVTMSSKKQGGLGGLSIACLIGVGPLILVSISIAKLVFENKLLGLFQLKSDWFVASALSRPRHQASPLPTSPLLYPPRPAVPSPHHSSPAHRSPCCFCCCSSTGFSSVFGSSSSSGSFGCGASNPPTSVLIRACSTSKTRGTSY